MLIIKHGLRCHYELRPQEEITFSHGFISYQLTKVEKRDVPADCLEYIDVFHWLWEAVQTEQLWKSKDSLWEK